MTIWLILILVLLITVAYGAMFGAPYLPTQKEQIDHALKLLDLRQGETVLDLGCGDGRFLLSAKELGLKAVGYEINPILFLVAKLRTRRFKDSIRVIFADASKLNLSGRVGGVYVFLMSKKLHQLESILKGSGVKVVSYAFEFATQRPIKSEKGLNLYQF